MINMKKIISLAAAAALACSPAAVSAGEEQEPLKIVTTIFPEYDWVRNILGDDAVHAEVSMLLDNGVDLHSYQPSVDDILKISTCDVFIYVGGESDAWVSDALKEAVNPDMVVLNLLDLLGDAVREEEVVEGMQHDHDHDSDHEEEGDDHQEEEGDEYHEEEDEHHEEDSEDHHEEEEHDHEHEEAEYDEHVWLSLRNASVLVTGIAEAIGQQDTDCAEKYRNNAAAYLEKLGALDAVYQETVDAAPVKTLLFGDRFPFRYMTDDYGLTYYAAFSGCSAETEASFETITFLAQKVDELSLHSVLTIEGTDHRIAETIVQNTKSGDQQILTLDSMQSITAKDVENGTDYLSVMESNLDVLKEALK